MSSQNKLTESINKSMTISDIQKELKASNVSYTGVKKKSDYVSLYVTNGLHNKDKLSTIQEEIESIPKVEVSKLPAEVAKIIVLEELIVSMTIMGHGCEDLLTPWIPDQPISQYFKNNVRVYSRSCVPDVNAIGNIYTNEYVIRDIQRRFSNVPKGETADIIDAYSKDVKGDYIRNVESMISSNHEMVKTPGFKRLSKQENLSKASSLSTYLANKHFTFYDGDPQQKLTQLHQHLYKSLGLQVTDIRLKKTGMDGSVSYEQIFSPINSNFVRQDIANFNLIYRDGLTNILKNILNRKDLIKPALALFGFTGRQERIMNLTLEQIYDFFQLVGVKYANLMDYSCRACSIGRIPQGLSEQIYSVEQKYSVKPVAFGLKRKFTKKRKNNKKTNSKNKTRNKTRNIL